MRGKGARESVMRGEGGRVSNEGRGECDEGRESNEGRGGRESVMRGEVRREGHRKEGSIFIYMHNHHNSHLPSFVQCVSINLFLKPFLIDLMLAKLHLQENNSHPGDSCS